MLHIALPFLSLLAAPAAASCSYLLALTLLSARNRVPAPSTRTMQFDIIIPAHNEESGIASAVRSALAVDWPADRFRVVVVADNCSDATAEVAARAGAQVLVRTNTELRGKGHALAFAFQESRQHGQAQAVVVVDADSSVSPNLIEAIASRLERGEKAVQVHYGVSNTDASWRTRLMAIAMSAFHVVRSRARERLGLSCGVRGNGWAVTHALLDAVPYTSFSLAEDLEFGVKLGMEGIRVAYADEAHCNGEMVAGEKDARSQRRRWEQGRAAIVRSHSMALLRNAVATRNRVSLDLALDLLVPPLSYVALNVVALLVAAGLAWQFNVPGPWFGIGLLSAGALALYVLRGWQLSGTGLRGLADLAKAPFFLAWKIVVMVSGRRATEWVRTNRNRD